MLAIKRTKGTAGRLGRRIGDRKLQSASTRTASRPKRRVGRTVADGGGRESRAEERQRQNATNSKRAESCACIRNAIGPLSTGAGSLLSTGVVAGGRARGGGHVGAPGAAGRRKILIAPISIFGRSFACSLFGKPTKIPPVFPRHSHRLPKPIFFSFSSPRPRRGTRKPCDQIARNRETRSVAENRLTVAAVADRFTLG